MEDEKKFDFGDGNGPVPAHRHPNGGGWVADTAFVDKSAVVEEGALVYGVASVYGTVALESGSRVYGDAELEGSLCLKDGAQVYGDVELDYFSHLVLYEGVLINRTPIVVTRLFPWTLILISSPKQLVAVGCEVHSPGYWRKHAREIAREYHASRGSVPKLMALLDLVYGKPRKRRGKNTKKKK